jgi:hypothetical protein
LGHVSFLNCVCVCVGVGLTCAEERKEEGSMSRNVEFGQLVSVVRTIGTF